MDSLVPSWQPQQQEAANYNPAQSLALQTFLRFEQRTQELMKVSSIDPSSINGSSSYRYPYGCSSGGYGGPSSGGSSYLYGDSSGGGYHGGGNHGHVLCRDGTPNMTIGSNQQAARDAGMSFYDYKHR